MFLKQLLLVSWIAIRELVHERVFYLLVIFAVFSWLVSLLLGQMTYAEQAKLTLDFMLAGTQISLTLFCVFMGIRLFNNEMTSGSIAMILSKPVSRGCFLLGKFLGQVVVQLAVALLMTLMTWLICMRFGEAVSDLALIQASLFIFLEITVLTAVTYLFAVNGGVVIASLGALSVFCLGHLRNTLISQKRITSSEGWVWSVLKNFIPDLEMFNIKSLASYGHSVTWLEFQWVVLYAIVCVVFFFSAALICFSQKDIST